MRRVFMFENAKAYRLTNEDGVTTAACRFTIEGKTHECISRANPGGHECAKVIAAAGDVFCNCVVYASEDVARQHPAFFAALILEQ